MQSYTNKLEELRNKRAIDLAKPSYFNVKTPEERREALIKALEAQGKKEFVLPLDIRQEFRGE